MTQSVYNEPIISTYPSYIASQTLAFDICIHSLFPGRRSSPVVLQVTVGGGEDLGMRLLLCEMYASGKR